MAFGISGDPNGVRMVGGDVTWAWMDNTGVNARDLYLSEYSQVILSHIINHLFSLSALKGNVYILYCMFVLNNSN